MNAAVVLLSGGLDSTVALAMALRRWESPDVLALSIDYGQRHRIELGRAARIASLLGVEHKTVRVALPMQGSLVAPRGIIDRGNVVIPGRNTILLTVATGEAVARGATHVVVGCCGADAELFPDCRDEYLDAMARALSLGFDAEIEVVAPLVHQTKAETVALMVELGCQRAVALSWTCYDPQNAGARTPLQCGACMACALRAEGFATAGVADPGAR